MMTPTPPFTNEHGHVDTLGKVLIVVLLGTIIFITGIMWGAALS